MSDKYTQREWDRTVGWGKVPKKYDKDYIKGSDPEYEFDNLVSGIEETIRLFYKRHEDIESDNNERIQPQDDKSPRDNSKND
jgi:hypothetical protein